MPSPRLTMPAAIIVGAIVIAAAIVGAQFVPRYQFGSAGFSPVKIDTRTGQMEACSVSGTYVVMCHP